MTDTAHILENLNLTIDGHVLIASCIEVTFYFYRTPHGDVQDFATKALAALDQELTHYVTGNMRKFAKRGKKSEDTFATMFNQPRDGAYYWISYRGAAEGISAATLEIPFRPLEPFPSDGPKRAALIARNKENYEIGNFILTPPVDVVRATFPLTHPLAQPDALRAWIMELQTVKNASFVGGHAGYALNIQTEIGSRALRGPMDQMAAAALARYPGLGINSTGSTPTRMMRYWPKNPGFLPGFKRAQWLTIVNDLMLNEVCEGRDKVEAALAENSDVIVHNLNGGLIVQAGGAPAVGDVTAGDHLPAYRTVAKALSKGRVPEFSGFGRAFNNEAANAWLTALERPID